MAAPTVRGTCTPITFVAAASAIVVDTVGAQNGDILVVFAEFAEAAGDITTYPDANWATDHRTTGGGQAGICGYKLTAASEGVSWTFTFGSGVSRTGIITVVIIDGSTTDNTTSGTGAGQQTASGTSHATPSLTTGENDALVLSHFGADTNTTKTWTGGGTTELMDAEEATANINLAVYSSVQATAGSVSKTGTSSGNQACDTGIIAFSPNAGLGGTVNQNTETDTAQSIAKSKTKAIGQNTETNLSQAINRSKSKAIGINAETDTAQAIAWSPKHRLVGQNSETDNAQAISWSPKNRLVALNTETDSVLAISARKVKAVGQISETDSAQVITRVKNRTIGQSSEADTAQAITRVKRLAVNQVTETDLSQPITEGESGQIVVPVNQVSETDAAQSITADKIKTIGQNSETDAAQSITRVKRALISQVSETDLTQALFPLKRVSVVQVVETDLSQAITADKVKQIGQVSEADSAQTIAWSPKKRLVNQVAETDMAQSIIVPDTITLFPLTLYPRDISLDLFARSRGLSLDERIELFTVKEEV